MIDDFLPTITHTNTHTHFYFPNHNTDFFIEIFVFTSVFHSPFIFQPFNMVSSSKSFNLKVSLEKQILINTNYKNSKVLKC